MSKTYKYELVIANEHKEIIFRYFATDGSQDYVGAWDAMQDRLEEVSYKNFKAMDFDFMDKDYDPFPVCQISVRENEETIGTITYSQDTYNPANMTHEHYMELLESEAGLR